MGKFLLAAAAALTAMLHIANADPTEAAVCDTDQPRLEGDPSGEDIANILANSYTQESLCSGLFEPPHDNEYTATQPQYGMLYNVSRIDNGKGKNIPLFQNCTTAFTNIVSQCIRGDNYWGGTWSSIEAVYSIRNTMYPDTAFPPNVVQRRATPPEGPPEVDVPIVTAIVDPPPANWEVIAGPMPLPSGPLPDA